MHFGLKIFLDDKTLNMKFELQPSQLEKLKEWQDRIKDLFGKYGRYSYTFTPTGIGNVVTVKSELTRTDIDLTEEDDW